MRLAAPWHHKCLPAMLLPAWLGCLWRLLACECWNQPPLPPTRVRLFQHLLTPHARPLLCALQQLHLPVFAPLPSLPFPPAPSRPHPSRPYQSPSCRYRCQTTTLTKSLAALSLGPAPTPTAAAATPVVGSYVHGLPAPTPHKSKASTSLCYHPSLSDHWCL